MLRSATNELKTFLVFPEDVVAAVGAVVRFVQTALHEEGDAAEERRHAATQECAPHIGRISRLQVHYCQHRVLARRARKSRRVVVAVHPDLETAYVTGGCCCTMMGGGGG